MMDKLSDYKLKIDIKTDFHGHTVRKNIPRSLWNKIRLAILEEYNYTCSVCGNSPPEEQYKTLNVHEIEEHINDEIRLCVLKGLDLLCWDCHAFQHIGRTLGVLSEEQINKLILHFMKVNNCSKSDYKEYYRSIMQKNAEMVMERISKIRKGSVAIEKSVFYRIDAEIPYKEDVIKQLADKGIYKF
ncbi:hypothetical protein ACE41H_21335 [Paenibacillus enshidis]|uniref:HNH endonuclease n=1 Tax=Paenibacillus enshidis TaxID=1458439 RepID=A0ABV5AYL7_9BACL